MATNMYLVITDGTTTVTIADGEGGAVNYKLRYGTWAPTIAGLRRSKLGGRGPYADAIEELSLDIYGATAAAAYANLQTLITLLDQAERWSSGENVSAVLLKYSPGGGTVSSAANPLQAAILGRAEGDATVGVQLNAEFNETQHTFTILGVTVRFVRRGLWLHTGQSVSPSGTNGDVVSADFGAAANYFSPTRLAATNIGFGADASDIIAILADSSAAVAVYNAEDFSSATDYSSVADTGAKARNSNVLRFTPTATTERASNSKPIPGVFRDSCTLLAVFANVRNNSGTTIFSLRSSVDIGDLSVYTPPIIIDPTFSNPTWMLLGIIAANSLLQSVQVLLTANAASGTLDMDSLVLVDISKSGENVVAINSPLSGSGKGLLTIDHRALDKPTPRITSFVSETTAIGYKGDAWLSSLVATDYVLILQTGSTSGKNFWRFTDAGTVQPNSLTLTRTLGYLTPV